MAFEYDLFISYCHEDKPFVLRLVDALTVSGINCWVDEKLDVADPIVDTIEKKMKSSRGVALVVSHSSKRSAWVKLESEYALMQCMDADWKRPVIPLKIDDAPIPGFLRIWKAILFDTPDRFDPGVSELANRIRVSPVDPDAFTPQPGIDLDEIILQAKKEFVISGHTLDKFATDPHVKIALGTLLTRGVKATLVLLNPHSRYAKAHAPFHSMETTGSSHEEQIKGTIKFLHNLFELHHNPETMTVLLTNYMPRFRTILIDDETCYVSLYLFGEDVGSAPELILRRTDLGSAGAWFETIRTSLQKMIGSTVVVPLIEAGRFNKDWEATKVCDFLTTCPKNSCCLRPSNCWEDVHNVILGSQNTNPMLASNLGICGRNYEPGTYRIGEISGDAQFIEIPCPFEDWLTNILDEDFERIQQRHPVLFNRISVDEAKQAVRAALDFTPPRPSIPLKNAIWVQEYSDVIRRLTVSILTGNPNYELDLYPELAQARKDLILSVIDRIQRERRPRPQDWLRLSVAAGLLGVREKSTHAATSTIFADHAIDLLRPNETLEETVRRVADEMWQAANTQYRVDATGAFFCTMELHRDGDTRLVSFTDDFLETIVLLKFYDALISHFNRLEIDCVPRSIRCSNDATYSDVQDLLANFPNLRGSGRFHVCSNGPKLGGVNLTKLHPEVMDLIRRATIIDVRGARNFEMMQGINAEGYFGFMVCREISEAVTGMTAADLPFVYVRQTAGDLSFRGFRSRAQRRREDNRMLAEVTVMDNKRKWEGGHLANFEHWPTQRRERFMRTHSFYDSQAIPFDSRFGALLEPEVQDDLRAFSGRVLAIGCGSGKEVEFLSRIGCDAYGMDFSPDAIVLAKQRLPGMEERFFVEDIYNLDTVLDGEFDGIVANAILLHLLERSDMLPMLKAIRRRLKVGGIAYVRLIDKPTVPEQQQMDDNLFGKARWFVYFNRDQLKALAEEAGFTVTKLEVRPHARVGHLGVFWISALLKSENMEVPSNQEEEAVEKMKGAV